MLDVKLVHMLYYCQYCGVVYEKKVDKCVVCGATDKKEESTWIK